MKQYNIITKNNDPEITIQLPAAILRDLALRAEENGSTMEMEFAKRLARSLEGDLEMIEQDNAYAFAAFEMMSKANKV
jgi:hypothetical protein